MKTSILFLVTTLFIYSSCTVMYIPNALNVPLFNEKKEVKVNVSLYDYQFAYALTKNIGLMANGYLRNSDFTTNNLDWNYSANRSFIEGGIGYFDKLSEGFVYEMYAGGGIGNMNYNSYEAGNTYNVKNSYSADFNRFFIQPSIGYTSDYVDISFSTRIIRLAFNNIKIDNYTPQMLIEEEINDLDKVDFFFIEPALTIKFGYKWVKLQTQFVYSNKINIEPLNYQRFTVNLGLHIDIAPRFKTSKTD